MLDFIVYILPALALGVGLLFFFVGRVKNNNKLVGIGIGFIACLMIVELPGFIDGFINGFVEGFNG